MSPAEIAELYRIALTWGDGNADRARALLEAYLSGQDKLLPYNAARRGQPKKETNQWHMN